jgi:hypothetical protein
MRVLLLATTTGYQTRSFGEAAERLGVELVFATDRCAVIDDPWSDHAVPIRFYDEEQSVASILASATSQPIDGVLAVGDRPTVIAARVAQALVDGVNRQVEMPGHRLGVVAGEEQAQRLLLLLGEGLVAAGHRYLARRIWVRR